MSRRTRSPSRRTEAMPWKTESPVFSAVRSTTSSPSAAPSASARRDRSLAGMPSAFGRLASRAQISATSASGPGALLRTKSARFSQALLGVPSTSSREGRSPARSRCARRAGAKWAASCTWPSGKRYFAGGCGSLSRLGPEVNVISVLTFAAPPGGRSPRGSRRTRTPTREERGARPARAVRREAAARPAPPRRA